MYALAGSRSSSKDECYDEANAKRVALTAIVFGLAAEAVLSENILLNTVRLKKCTNAAKIKNTIGINATVPAASLCALDGKHSLIFLPIWGQSHRVSIRSSEKTTTEITNPVIAFGLHLPNNRVILRALFL